MQYIGDIDIGKLGEYKDKIATNRVIITDERVQHIKKRHPGDYEKYIEYIPSIINNPDYILEDKDSIDTILVLRSIQEKNIQLVIKLQTNFKDKDKYNSILTFWHIRKRNYISTIKNNKIIYKKMDKNE